MTQPETREARAREAMRELRGLIVVEMAEASRDTALQAIGIRAEREELCAVVRFDQRGVALGEEADEAIRDAADVGGDADGRAALIFGDADGDLRSVVRDGLGLDDERADAERTAGLVGLDVEAAADAVGVETAMHPDPRAERAGERGDLAEVIAVLVGRDDRVDAIACALAEADAEALEAGLGLARADAGVDEDTRPGRRFHEEGVTARPCPQNEDAHWHMSLS